MERHDWQKSLFWITLTYFALGFVNIVFALLGLVCFTMPFYLDKRYKRKVWCQQICPRAGLFSVAFSKIGLHKPMPKWLRDGRGRKWVLRYFTMNIFFATMSTIMVSLGRIAPIAQVRFLIVFGLPWKLPQLLNLNVPANVLHVSYRVFSMMFTSTIVGLILAFIYAPRSWCAICPINSLMKKSPSSH